MSNETLAAAGGSDADLRRNIALFRYGLIADLLHLPPHARGLYKSLRQKEAEEYEIPGTLRRRVAAETIRGWLRDYRRGGFDGLLPKPRSDQGSTRSIPSAVVDILCHIKDEERTLSVADVIQAAREKHATEIPEDLRLPLSTVHRLLARRGLTRPAEDAPDRKDRRRFQYEDAGDLWMSDVMYGPKLRLGHRHRQTYLIAFIDDATRLIPQATFALSEGTIAFLSVLEQAVRRRGLPKRLYVDNGSAFRSTQLGVVCAKLGIALIHAKPYTPQGKGKIERWFRTVRMQFLQGLPSDATTTLQDLNRALAHWVEMEYHHAPHRGLDGETPAARWAQTSGGVRLADAGLGDIFLFEQRRKVAKDRTVTLDGIAFEADAALIGETVILKYDPALRPEKRVVQVWHRGRRTEDARPVDKLANCYVKRNATTRNLELGNAPEPEAPEGLALRDLVSAEDEDGLF